jgi:hypothetical protein
MYDVLHQELRHAKARNAPASVLDVIMAYCPDGECAECGKIICPHSNPMHFHHDGCPACAVGEST